MKSYQGERGQLNFLPKSIEEYVQSNDPVRAYDAFIEALVKERKVNLGQSSCEGHPEYDRITMLKILMYSYSYGIRSSRQIERACHHNLSYIWLSGGLKPDHKTIARFRKDHVEDLKRLLKECVKMCMKLDLIDGNVLFVDGTKLRANASMSQTWNEERCKKALERIEEKIEALLKGCEDVDESESDLGSAVKMPAELSDQKKLKEKVEKILKELNEEGKSEIKTTDPDSAIMKGRQGTHESYNVQQVVDDKEGLIVNVNAVSACNDKHEFAEQLMEAKMNLGKSALVGCGDSGYATTAELKKAEENGIRPIVAPQKQGLTEGQSGAFNESKFKYDEERDVYVCPEGLDLKPMTRTDRSQLYRSSSGKVCRDCRHFGICTTSNRGRTTQRFFDAAWQKKFREDYESAEGQNIYKRRKEKAEHPFGWIKRSLGVQSFLLRGISAVNGEASLFALSFNLRRMLTILGGVEGFLVKVKA